MSNTEYRPDIDGLRALAVLTVLFFHLDVAGFGGGFVGVDVFFVISGFLITRLIRAEVDRTGSFSFSNFYIRRARRLFPALFFTLVVCFAIGTVLFSPPHLERLGGSVVHAVASISNFFFWSEAGYFDTEASTKPLLHTWSLGVEEQFYIFWPAVLVFLLVKSPKFGAPVMLVLGGTFSLYLNLVFSDGQSPLVNDLSTKAAAWIEDGRATIFYLAPFRVFEFAMGALIVWLTHLQPGNRALSDLSVLVGLALILYAVFAFDNQTLFPSVNALVPCLGAALVIHSGANAKFVNRLLSNRIAVGIGLVSYSLYLVHWPLIVFWKYYTFDDLGIGEKFVIGVSSLILAYLMYRFIESPFRRSAKTSTTASNYAYALYCALLSLVLVVPTANAWANRGWEWRLPEELRQASEGLDEKIRNYWYSGGIRQDKFSEKTLNVVVIGDSYAIDAVHMLSDRPDIAVHFDRPTSWRCRAFTLPNRREDARAVDECPGNRAKFDRAYKGADIVLLGDSLSTWDSENVEWVGEIERNIASLRANGFNGPVVIYGERPVYEQYVHDIVMKFGRLNGADKFASKLLVLDVPGMKRRVETAEKNYQERGLYYFSPIHQLCGDTSCEVLTPDKKLMYFDEGHFSYEADKYLAKALVTYLKDIEASALGPASKHAMQDGQ